MFDILTDINRVLWEILMPLLFGGCAVYFTYKLKFIQLRRFREIFTETIGAMFKKDEKNDSANEQSTKKITPFAAMSAALAATAGVGNIAGVATAITAGGAGAIFWMWVSAYFCMAIKYAEVYLAKVYRRKNGEGYIGGPMYYIRDGLGKPVLAGVFAVMCVLCSFGIGNLVQSNAAGEALNRAFSIPAGVSGVLLAAVTAVVIFGGARRIYSFTSRIIPVMSLFYIAFALIVIIARNNEILPAFGRIFSEAWSFQAVGGGAAGYAISRALRFGLARGIFTNEAGLGSSPIAHAAAEGTTPARQGMWGMFEVFADTHILCTLTALVILTAGGTFTGILDGTALTLASFASVLGGGAEIFLAAAITLFALASMVGWAHYGTSCVNYMSGGRGISGLFYKMVFVCVIYAGAVSLSGTVWLTSDLLNALMAVPNLIALVMLADRVKGE